MPSQSNYGYGNQTTVENLFDPDTISMWSNEPYKTGMTANQDKLQFAMNQADAEIVQTFYSYGNFVTPLVPLGASVFAIQGIWAAITADYLRKSRGLTDTDVCQFCDVWKSARQKLRALRTPEGGLNAARRWPASNAPQAG